LAYFSAHYPPHLPSLTGQPLIFPCSDRETGYTTPDPSRTLENSLPRFRLLWPKLFLIVIIRALMLPLPGGSNNPDQE
jgi:hypothetical protein